MADKKAEKPQDGHTRTYYADERQDDEDIIDLGEELPPPPPPPGPKSQALMDIQEAGLTPEEAARVSKELSEPDDDDEPEEKPAAKKKTGKGKKKASERSGAENLAVIARFRWTFLLVLSVISVGAWTAEAFLSDRPYQIESAAWLALTILVALPIFKFLRLPTRSGLTALLWSGTFVVSALYGPPEFLYGDIPAALIWAGLLVLIMLWMAVAIWRKLGRFRVVDILLTLVLIFAALAPVGALITSISSGAALNLNFAALSANPGFITEQTSWLFLWPMTTAVAVILPLCALFSLWDQFSAFRRRGARHGGNFFLALAFVLLLPYAFLSYDQAVSEFPQVAQKIRSVWPAAVEYARENQAQAPAAVVKKAPAKTETPAPPAATETPAAAEAPAPAEAPAAPPALWDPAPAPLTEETPTRVETTAPVSPPATKPAVREEAADPVAPVITPPPSLEERLQLTDQRLGQALSRIEALEREIKLMKEAETPAAEPEDYFLGNDNN